jgi:hypothetical protein
METAVVRLSMPGGVGGQRREPLPTRLENNANSKIDAPEGRDIGKCLMEYSFPGIYYYFIGQQ